MTCRARFCSLIVCVASLGATFPASAQDYGDPSGRALTVVGDLRVVAVDGERSWIDGGFGKTRFGPDQPNATHTLHADLLPVEGDLVWSPQLGWRFGATIAVTAQNGQEHAVDLSEAFLTYRHDPIGKLRVHARAGLFWPPISLEHSGPEWAVTEMITPSAINSWVGEEVKVAAGEATASLPLGPGGGWGRLSATAAIFGLNDTAGTLLAYRGWALHDEKATAFGRQPLPPLDPFSVFVQAKATRPVIELDNRPGYYLRLGWAPDERIRLHAFYYDNRGDPEAVTADLQWGWRTHFIEAGGSAMLGTATKLTVQGLSGHTVEGFAMPTQLWSDMRFRSDFALLTQTIGRGSVSGRIKGFDTHSDGSVLGVDESEYGWAATLAARRAFGPHVTVLAEALHVDSRRDARRRSGLDPHQPQTVLQLALRLHR